MIDRVPRFCQPLMPNATTDFSRSDFYSYAPVLRGPVWIAVPDRRFSSPGEAVLLPGVVRLPVHPDGFLFIIAKMNFESMQALPKSHFRSLEPQRHHRNALSGFSHFPQSLVLLGLPYSSGVLCT